MNKKTRENLSMIIEVLDLIVTLIGLFICNPPYERMPDFTGSSANMIF